MYIWIKDICLLMHNMIFTSDYFPPLLYVLVPFEMQFTCHLLHVTRSVNDITYRVFLSICNIEWRILSISVSSKTKCVCFELNGRGSIAAESMRSLSPSIHNIASILICRFVIKEYSNALLTNYNVWLWLGVDGTQTSLGVWRGWGLGGGRLLLVVTVIKEKSVVICFKASHQLVVIIVPLQRSEPAARASVVFVVICSSPQERVSQDMKNQQEFFMNKCVLVYRLF